MKQSEKLTTLLDGLAKAQAEFPTLPKDKNGYNYKYTDLDTVISTLRPILSKHNIGFMQSLTTTENGKAAITTRLFNTAGEWLEDSTPLPDVSLAKGNAAQNLGAAITYMKRYTLCAMLGVSCDEDPDGKPDGNPDFNARKQPQNNAPKSQPQSQEPMGGPDTPEQRKIINELIKSTYKDGSKIFSKKEIDGLLTLRMNHTAGEVIEELKKTIAERRTQTESAPAAEPEPFPEDIPGDPIF